MGSTALAIHRSSRRKHAASFGRKIHTIPPQRDRRRSPLYRADHRSHYSSTSSRCTAPQDDPAVRTASILSSLTEAGNRLESVAGGHNQRSSGLCHIDDSGNRGAAVAAVAVASLYGFSDAMARTMISSDESDRGGGRDRAPGRGHGPDHGLAHVHAHVHDHGCSRGPDPDNARDPDPDPAPALARIRDPDHVGCYAAPISGRFRYYDSSNQLIEG